MDQNNEDNELIALFPGLAISGFQRTSPATPDYNCIAWAVGETIRWWESAGLPGYYWPKQIKDDGSIKSIVAVFRLAGFKRCKNADFREGYEKIAIYGDADEFTHVAKQLENGTWSSKIGKLSDLSHPDPGCLSGVEYGSVKIIMQKKRKIDKCGE